MTAQSYRAALYLRLSREDGEHVDGSESIRNQRELLRSYAEEQGFPVCGEYADDGFSGTRFDRPAFQRMLRDIEAGGVDIVLTKDLSRLGRDYILTGHYIERYFPEHSVRYIAVNDGVDTGDSCAANDMTPFKAVINDLYARDISQKVRSALETKRKSGKFVGARAPYGYRKDPADKNHLTPDEDTAEHVRRLFRLFLGGESLCGAARRMDALGILPPGSGAIHWNDATVRRILTNPAYAGDLAQGRTRKLGYKVKKRATLPREAWTVAQNAHEALVPRVEYEEAQALLAKRARHSRGERVKVHPLAGLVFCEECGGSMTLLRQEKREYFVCSRWKRGGMEGCSASHCTRADAVLEAVLAELRHCVAGLAPAKLLPEMGRELRTTDRLEQRKQNAENALVSLYRDKARGLLPEEEYLRVAEVLRREQRELETRLVQERQSAQGEKELLLSLAKQLLKLEGLGPGELAVLVERVTVGAGKTVTVRFAFCCPTLVDKPDGL